MLDYAMADPRDPGVRVDNGGGVVFKNLGFSTEWEKGKVQDQAKWDRLLERNACEFCEQVRDGVGLYSGQRGLRVHNQVRLKRGFTVGARWPL